MHGIDEQDATRPAGLKPMTDDADPKLHCHACGHLISGPVRTYRCPACGSYDVALIPLPEKLHENPADRVGRSTPIVRIPPIRYLLPTPPEGVPGAMWQRLRSLRMFGGLTLMLLGASLIASLVLAAMNAPRIAGTIPPAPAKLSIFPTYLPYIALGAFSVLTAATPLLARRRLRRFEHEIIEDNLEICLECGYPLKGLPAQHRCPECGEPYNIAVVKRTWERYFEAQKKSPHAKVKSDGG